MTSTGESKIMLPHGWRASQRLQKFSDISSSDPYHPGNQLSSSMSAGKYWLLTFMALVIAALIVIEIVCENQVALLSAAISRNQTYLNQAQQQTASVRQLVQRIAAESQRDPALLEILNKRGIHVTSNPSELTPAIAPLSTTPTPPPK